ncbi:hypothetical protein ACIQXW_01515 [Lysinibacillus sp. NPDC097162]|uniref:hypothetical protein n=1 Tax=unclassified Lysinibacillus TaxID=2636778 RepID=UPI00380F09D2
MKNIVTLMGLLLLLLYFYKTPMLDTKDAVLKAEMYLNNPPQHTYTAQMNVNVKELTTEQINTQLHNQTGMLNRMFNRKEWVIMLQFDNRNPTVVIDAHNGKLIQIIGATH